MLSTHGWLWLRGGGYPAPQDMPHAVGTQGWPAAGGQASGAARPNDGGPGSCSKLWCLCRRLLQQPVSCMDLWWLPNPSW